MAINWVGIVRPYETPKVTPPPTPAKADPSTNKNVVIICGENSSPKTFSGSFRFDQTYYKIRRPKEKKKAT